MNQVNRSYCYHSFSMFTVRVDREVRATNITYALACGTESPDAT